MTRGSAPATPLPGLILASASPRRRELLRSLGIEFEIVVPDTVEITEGDPEQLVIENARRKARAGMDAVRVGRPTAAPALVLGVDTEVVLDGRAVGKAADRGAALARLEALSARTHSVLSGVVVLARSGGGATEERSGVSRSEVTFRDLDAVTIERYLASGEWRDRAGAYAIQGLGSTLVERVEGDFSNVVGLPLRLLIELAPELLDGAGDSVSGEAPQANP